MGFLRLWLDFLIGAALAARSPGCSSAGKERGFCRLRNFKELWR